ncbi:MAG: glucose-6-phosphate dehydrogenase assembly protein OpcA [Deltaproteobacteria bacterium]|nr:glucose-6-phosphate dehydrogenase assembly protein OpcA [Deltaproteobacteria bacterium]
MNEVFAYTPIPVGAIAKALSDNMPVPEGDEQHYVRAANVNTLMVVDAGYDSDDLESYLLTLSQVHPNRSFVIVIDQSRAEIGIEYSARCHAIGPKEHVCSEVIRLSAPSSSKEAVASIVRANLLTGMPSELCVYRPPKELSLVHQMAQLAEQVLFSSSDFENSLSALVPFLQENHLLVDLDWVKLGIWRDQIREVFDRPAWAARLADIERIEIRGESPHKGSIPIGALLLGGWLANQMDYKIVSGKGSVFTLEATSGKRISLVLTGGDCGDSSKVKLVTLEFSAAHGAPAGVVNMRRCGNGSGRLETAVNLGEEFRFSKLFDDEDRNDLIMRYFFIGESTLNYPKSLRIALAFSGVEV